eukprot:TRINITY_DN508_c0_g1_i1.p1 TRINITY_DN508_c0_g1~~TRINITY_DN508_c0_g1_i1.p1  ORF type:complete len:224 (+),score=87.50 TRINITY_DN508_c0_g1_i1:354-1025(+)
MLPPSGQMMMMPNGQMMMVTAPPQIQANKPTIPLPQQQIPQPPSTLKPPPPPDPIEEQKLVDKQKRQDQRVEWMKKVKRLQYQVETTENQQHQMTYSNKQQTLAEKHRVEQMSVQIVELLKQVLETKGTMIIDAEEHPLEVPGSTLPQLRTSLMKTHRELTCAEESLKLFKEGNKKEEETKNEAESDLPEGWAVYYHTNEQEEKVPYYHHKEKEITQWEKPTL